MDKNQRRKRMQALFLVAIVLVACNIIQMSDPVQDVTIACVGDSITYGYGLENREAECYPVVLQGILEDNYHVSNLGVNGVIVQKEGDQSYWDEDRYEQSRTCKPSIVILMLGTNDAKEENWKDSETFRKDYEAMIDSYLNLETKPDVILMTPMTIFSSDVSGESVKAASDEIIREEAQVIMEIAEAKEVSVIDMYQISSEHPEWFSADGIHPNKDGAAAIAKAVKDKMQQLIQK